MSKEKTNRPVRRKWVRRLAVLVITLTVIHQALNAALGTIVADVFAEGSGCSVQLSDPQIRYFPLRASVKDVRIFCAEEGPERGYRADLIRIELEFTKLLRKYVVVNKLELTGSDLVAFGEDTALFKVLEFIFKKPALTAEPPPRPWHAFLTRGWRAWVPYVSVSTKSSAGTHLTIGTKDVYALFDEATFISRDPIDNPQKPVLFEMFGSNLRVVAPGVPQLPLGKFRSYGQIIGGVWTFERAVIEEAAPADPERASVSEASGTLSMPGAGEYNLNVRGELFDSYLAKLAFPIEGHLMQLAPHLGYNVRVSGALTDPEIIGDLKFSMGKAAALFVRDECALRELTTKIAINAHHLMLQDIKAEDIIKESEFIQSFEPPQTFEARTKLAFDTNGDYLKRCFYSASPEQAAKLRPVSLALTRALEDSTTTITVNGNLGATEESNGPVINGEIVSDIYVREAYARSQLQAKLKYKDQNLHAEFEERGSVPKISSDVKPDNNRSAAPQTPFKTEYSTFHAELDFALPSKQLTVSKLNIARYPSDRIFARIAPFMPTPAFEKASAVLTRESVIDATAEFEFSFVDFTGQGVSETAVSELMLGPLPVKKLKVPLRFDAGGLHIPEFVVDSPGGVISGRADAAAGGKVDAVLTARGFDVTQLTLLEPARNKLAAIADIDFSAGGTFAQPVYQGTAVIVSDAEATGKQTTKIALKGDHKALEVEGELFGKDAEFRLRYPLNAADSGQMEITATATEFPLQYFLELDEVVQDPAVKRMNTLSGTFAYAGNINDPLSGSGDLEISYVALRRNEVQLASRDPLKAVIKNGRLDFQQVRVFVDDKELEVRGLVDRKNGWQASIEGDWALGMIVGRTDVLEQVSGDLRIELAVRGAPTAPRLEGTLNVRDGLISLPLGNSIVGADSVNARMSVEGDVLRIESIEAKLGEGRLKGQGQITNLYSSGEREVEVEFDITAARLEPVANLAVGFDGTIAVTQQGINPLLVKGEISVSEALYEQRLDIATAIRAITKVVLGGNSAEASRKSSDAQSPIALDVRVKAANHLLIETDIAQAELQGDVRVTGNPPRVLLDGKVTAVDGAFKFGSQEFDLVSAELAFSPQGLSLDPRLDFLAESQVETASGDIQQVRMSIGGTITAPKVKFSSDSGLPENEIVGMFGLSGGGLSVLTKSKDDYTFRELIDPRTSVGLRERIVGIAGFSDVQIDTGLSETSGEFVPRVRAKRPFLGDVEFDLQSELAGEQASKIGVDYPLTPYLNLTGGWRSRSVTEDVDSTSGEYSVGIEFKKSFPGLTLLPSLQPQRPVKEPR